MAGQLTDRMCTHGPRLAAVARHESAHAAAALMLGREVKRLAIEHDASGVCHVGAPSYPHTSGNVRRALREALLVSLAGQAAENAAETIAGWWTL